MKGFIEEDGITFHEYVNYSATRKRFFTQFLAKRICKKFNINKGIILDVGTGTGFLIGELKKRLGDNMVGVGIDIDIRMLTAAKEYQKGQQVFFVNNLPRCLPFRDDTFDFVVSESSFHHWEDPVHMLKEIRRVLKKGGKAYISDINRDSFFSSLLEKYYRVLMYLGRRRGSFIAFIYSRRKSFTSKEVEALVRKSGISHYSIFQKRACFEIIFEK